MIHALPVWIMTAATNAIVLVALSAAASHARMKMNVKPRIFVQEMPIVKTQTARILANAKVDIVETGNVVILRLLVRRRKHAT